MTTLETNNERLSSLIVNAEHDSQTLKPLLDASNTTLRELRMQVLPQLQQTTNSLDSLTHTISGLVTRIARDPSTVIRGTSTRPGPGE
jgi:ABC-type transporter Mla subunit MlaD